MNNVMILMLACKAYENKLKELMKPEDFELFTKAVSIEIFRADVLNWKDGDFKQFTLDHIDEITDDNFDAEAFSEKYPNRPKQSPWDAWGIPDPEEGEADE